MVSAFFGKALSHFAGRARVETEGLIGLFVNTLVLRVHLGDDPTVRELYARVREVTLGAYDHQDMPFEKLTEALGHGRDLRRSPLVAVTFQLRNFPKNRLWPAELEIQDFEFEGGGLVAYDLALQATESRDVLQLSCEYNTDLFDAATIDRLKKERHI